MNNWKEPGDGEYTRVLADGSVAKVFKQTLLWRAAVDNRMVDDIFFDAREAMQTVDEWDNGHGEVTFHPVQRRWLGDGHHGYSRKSQHGELKVTQSSCGNWTINQVRERCFQDRDTACRHADERLP
jgi:hypothetical protein